jgi:L-malate glycosyltransferase
MNVLFLHSGDNWIRGSEAALLTLLRGLDREKIVPFLFCNQAVLGDVAQKDGIGTIVYPVPQIMIDSGTVRLQFVQWVKTVYKVLSLVRKRNIRLLYCNGGRPSQVAYYVAKIAKIPIVCHVHSPYNRRYILLYRFHRASKVIFASRAIQTYIRGKQSLVAPSEVIYYGVDEESFRPAPERVARWREELLIPPDYVVFGQVSSLINRKGIDTVLRAVQMVSREYPKVRVVLVGDGPQRGEYVALVEELALKGIVHFVGYQPNPLPYYQHVFDVNVLASREEAFGISLVEGAACGLPNLGANADGIPEIILDHRTGLLFEPGNYRDLAEKMLELARNPSLRRDLGAAARRSVEERFSRAEYLRSAERAILERLGCN